MDLQTVMSYYPMLSEAQMLEWVKTLVPACCSAPTVTLLLAILFRKPATMMMYKTAGMNEMDALRAAHGRAEEVMKGEADK
jgi:hypothetical protein